MRSYVPLILIVVVLFILGIGSGYLLTRSSSGSSLGGKTIQQQPVEGQIKKGEVYGSSDTKAFSDEAEGTLEKGGLEGEGTHKLIRAGGESKTAYITSSILDLDQFVGRKVKVWGQTFQAQKAGWLMDVGRVEVLE